MIKQKQTRHHEIVNVGYVVIDETINYMINECCKLVQKEYKTRHDLVEKVIHWELCKKFKFDNTNKWSTHKPKSVKNETHTICDFEIETDHLISARGIWRIVDFAIPAEHRKEKKRKRI